MHRYPILDNYMQSSNKPCHVLCLDLHEIVAGGQLIEIIDVRLDCTTTLSALLVLLKQPLVKDQR
jgi:hypothetical protein